MPKVFISHSSIDKEFANKLAHDLRERKIDVWYDTWEMKVGDSLTKRIQEGIQESSYLIVVLSPNSVKSHWVEVELRAALNREIESGEIFVLPALWQPCEIPVFLKDKVYADFQLDYNKGIQSLLFSIGGSASRFNDSSDLLDKITIALIGDKVEAMSTDELAALVKHLEDRLYTPPKKAENKY